MVKVGPNQVTTLRIADLAVGLRPGTVRQTHRVLSLILDTAVTDGLIARNPAAGAKLPRQARAEPVFLTAQQVAELARASEPQDLPVLTLAFTGLRFGELAGLKVRRFDPVRRRLTVSESVTEVRGRLTWSIPKTHQTRSVPVPRTLRRGSKSSWMVGIRMSRSSGRRVGECCGCEIGGLASSILLEMLRDCAT
jgi:integrase